LELTSQDIRELPQVRRH